MPVKSNSGSTFVQTAGATTSFQITVSPTANKEKNAGAIVWVVHRPSAGAQAVCSLSIPGGNAELVQRKVDSDSIFTVECWRLIDCPPNSSFTITANFTKSVGTCVAVRHMVGVDASPRGFSNPAWTRGNFAIKEYNAPTDPGHFREFATSVLYAEKGSANTVVAGGSTGGGPGGVSGIGVFEIFRGGSLAQSGANIRITSLSSSSWLACAVHLHGHELADVGTVHSSEFSDAREEAMNIRADEKKSEHIVNISPVVHIPVNEGPGMTLAETLAIIRGNQ